MENITSSNDHDNLVDDNSKINFFTKKSIFYISIVFLIFCLFIIKIERYIEKEIITMASLIEREAKGSVDRNMISGILWNRFNKGILLQVDSAPETYKIKGLPDNPICNPGIEAIKSALNPENSSYLFYLHDKSGMIHYAVTFVEHQKNIVKYLK